MPVITNGADAVALLLLLFVLVRIDFSAWGKKTIEWYDRGSGSMRFTMARWLFTILWPAVHIILAASMYNYIRDHATFPGYYYDSVVILFFVFVFAESMWMPVFFKLKQVTWALVIIIFDILILLIILVLMGIEDEWTSFGLLLFYGLWSVYLLIFTALWRAYNGDPDMLSLSTTCTTTGSVAQGINNASTKTVRVGYGREL